MDIISDLLYIPKVIFDFLYNIFTNQTPVPQIFSSEIKTQEQSSGLLGNIQDQIQGIIGQQIQEIIPQNSIAKLLNLIVWSVFAGVAIMAGSQISGLGIKMIK